MFSTEESLFQMYLTLGCPALKISAACGHPSLNPALSCYDDWWFSFVGWVSATCPWEAFGGTIP